MTLAKDPFPEMQAGISSRPLVVFSEYARRCRMSPLPHLYRDLRSPVPHLHQDLSSPLPQLHLLHGTGPPLPSARHLFPRGPL